MAKRNRNRPPGNAAENEKTETLVSAREAWESTKAPQIRETIRAINDARHKGEQKVSVCGSNIPHAETLSMLLGMNYDVHVHWWDHSGGSWSTEVLFHRDAAGVLILNGEAAKEKLDYRCDVRIVIRDSMF